jgi:hypothetical protein
MKAATFSPPASGAEKPSETRLCRQLRAAVISENEAFLERLIGEMLSAQGVATGKSVALHVRVLLDVLHSLWTAALNDDVTGLYNRGGFVQTDSRAVHVATSDDRFAHLIYFDLSTSPRSRGPSRLLPPRRALGE